MKKEIVHLTFRYDDLGKTETTYALEVSNNKKLGEQIEELKERKFGKHAHRWCLI